MPRTEDLVSGLSVQNVRTSVLSAHPKQRDVDVFEHVPRSGSQQLRFELFCRKLHFQLKDLSEALRDTTSPRRVTVRDMIFHRLLQILALDALGMRRKFVAIVSETYV